MHPIRVIVEEMALAVAAGFSGRSCKERGTTYAADCLLPLWPTRFHGGVVPYGAGQRKSGRWFFIHFVEQVIAGERETTRATGQSEPQIPILLILSLPDP